MPHPEGEAAAFHNFFGTVYTYARTYGLTYFRATKFGTVIREGERVFLGEGSDTNTIIDHKGRDAVFTLPPPKKKK